MDLCCTNYSAEYLISINSNPPENITSDPCFCLAVYGPGTADIVGPGVIASFIIQLVLAVLFWGFQFTNYIILPLVRRGHHPGTWTRNCWLIHKYHEACVWNQLVFSFALCLAGFVRQTQKQQAHLGVYESASILRSVAVTAPATVLSTISFLPGEGLDDEGNPIPLIPLFGERRFVFGGAYVLSVLTGLLALLCPLFLGRVDNLLRLCEDYRKHHNGLWTDVTMSPLKDDAADFLGRTIGAVIAIIMGLVAWKYIQHDGGTRKLMLLLWTVASLYLWYIAFRFFRELLLMRAQMGIMWGLNKEQDAWTIGQIGALCSWAPILADISLCTGIPLLYQEDVYLHYKKMTICTVNPNPHT